MNNVCLIGNLAKDPEVRVVETQNGKVSVCNLTLAVNRYFKKQDGTKSSQCSFIPIICWSTSAETAGRYLTKGSKIAVEGSLQMDTWTTESGEHRSKMQVRCINFDMLDKKGDRTSNGNNTNTNSDTKVENENVNPPSEVVVNQPVESKESF